MSLTVHLVLGAGWPWTTRAETIQLLPREAPNTGGRACCAVLSQVRIGLCPLEQKPELAGREWGGEGSSRGVGGAVRGEKE